MGSDRERSQRRGLVKGRAEVLAKRLRSAGGTDAGAYKYADCPGLAAVVDVVTEYGAAITFSRTSNGGAFSVTIIDNGEYQRHYPHGDEELAALMQTIAEVYGSPE